jgi:hypothetical protein
LCSTAAPIVACDAQRMVLAILQLALEEFNDLPFLSSRYLPFLWPASFHVFHAAIPIMSKWTPAQGWFQSSWMKISAPAFVSGKFYFLCVQTDESIELRKYGKMVSIADKGPLDLFKCDALHGVNSMLNTIEYENMI